MVALAQNDMTTLRSRLHQKFVEPIDSNLRAMNLNNEPYIMATEDEMVKFIEEELDCQRKDLIEEDHREDGGGEIR